MENDIENHFNKEGNSHTNQQFLGAKEIFRGVVVKEWVGLPSERIYFSEHNKILSEKE